MDIKNRNDKKKLKNEILFHQYIVNFTKGFTNLFLKQFISAAFTH